MTAATQPAITLYSTDTCPWCERAKAYLKANNVPFVEKNVQHDYAAAVEMVRRSGQQGVPVIATDDEVILGFDQAKLSRMIQRVMGPKRPPLGLMAADAESFLRKRAELAPNYPEGIKGVYVGQVKPNSVAAAAGIKPGDVIVAAANKRVNNLAALDKLVDAIQAGESVSIRYFRGRDEQTATLQF